MRVDTVEGPAHWASYIVNGDATGFDFYNVPNNNAGDRDKADCDQWLAELAAKGWCVVSTVDDAEEYFGSFWFASDNKQLGCAMTTYVLHGVEGSK